MLFGSEEGKGGGEVVDLSGEKNPFPNTQPEEGKSSFFLAFDPPPRSSFSSFGK